MGADIHSFAEWRNPETGDWEMVGKIFEYPYSSFHTTPTRELLEGLSDYALVDLFDFEYGTERIETIRAAKSGELKAGDPTGEVGFDNQPRTYTQADIDHYARLKENPYGFPHDLAAKISCYHDAMDDGRIAKLREQYHERDEKGRHVIADEERDGWWDKAVHEARVDAMGGATLTDEERELLIQAAIDARVESFEEILERKRDIMARYPNDYPKGMTPEDVARARYEDEDNRLSIFLQGDEGKPWLTEEPIGSRSYTTFFLLGYEGRGARDVIEPISEPRGFPDDSPAGLKLRMKWGPDGHGDSYQTLASLKSYNLDASVDYDGFVFEESYERMKAEGWPDDPFVAPAGSVLAEGGGMTYFTPDGYEKWVKLGRPYIRQPDKLSIFADPIKITAELLPDNADETSTFFDNVPLFQDRRPEYARLVEHSQEAKVDSWKADYQWDDERIKEAEEALAAMDEDDFRHGMFEGRYIYHGVKPGIHVKWKAKRGESIGDEYAKAVEKLSEFAREKGVSDDDVRIVYCFDN